MSQFFINLNQYLKSKKLFSFIVFLLIFLGLGFLASRIGFEEDITKLIPSSKEAAITNKVLNQVSFSDKIIVYTEVGKDGTLKDLTNYATSFTKELKKETFNTYIKEVQGKIDEREIGTTLDFIYNNLPLFLSDSDYDEITKKITPEKLNTITQNNYKTLVSPSGIIAKKNIVRDPLGLTFMGLKKLQNLQGNENFELQNGFLVSKDHKNLLIFIKPKLASNETDKNTQFVKQLYDVQEKLNNQFKNKVHSEYFGSTVIAVANASQIKNDIQFTVSIAMTILLLILIFFYRKIYIPLILFTPTILGGLTAVAFLYLFKGKISAISLGIGSVLLGITLDYSLHVLTHFKENNNIKALYKDVTKPTLMSSITTAIAFLCLLFLKSEALQDLGTFAAISVFSASIFALIFIPIAYKSKTTLKASNNIIDKVAAVPYHKNKFLVFALLSIFVIAIFFSKKVLFDKDISKMNFQSEALKATEQKLDKLTNTNAKSLYTVSYEESIDGALNGNNKVTKKLQSLKDSKKIIAFSSIGSIVLSKEAQKERVKKWNLFWTPTKKEVLKNNLITFGNQLGFKPTTHQQFYNTLTNDFKTLSINEYKKLKALFIDEFISSKNDLSTVLSLVKVSESNYNEVTTILKSHEKQVVIDRQQMNETFLGNLKNDFNKLLQYSFIALLLILLLFFRSFELTFITIIPIILTWFITVGIMGILNVHFNIFNIIISTFIFGLGVDYSIFITNGLIKKHKYGLDELKTYKTSILLSVITTILGVGVLIFAKHPALKSISIVSIIGIISAMLIAYIIQPFLFNVLIGNRTKKGIAPIQFRKLIHTTLLNTFYALGGVLLSIFSITILPLIPISKKKKMTWLHKTAAKLVTATLYGNPFVKKEVQNPNNEKFDKPAVIISNHASSLDTLTIGLLTHNVIYLVNDWVYKSPIFGIIAKVLGFYPVSSGVDSSIDHLKEKVKQGYCLVVFPEGKRSFTNKIGRFHRGAFFLAKELGIDILPIYLHGNSEVLPKKDFIIYDGSLTVKVGKRIPYNEIDTYGKTERLIAKNIATTYKENFKNLRSEIEDENYFKNILFSNYYFKGHDLEQKIKTNFNENKKAYKELLSVVPFKTTINHIADDFGEIDILLVSESLDRKITCFIEDQEKRIIAENCYTTTDRKTIYATSFDEINTKVASILLVSKKCTLNDLKKLNYSAYQQIIVFNNGILADALAKQDFVVSKKLTNITTLTKN